MLGHTSRYDARQVFVQLRLEHGAEDLELGRRIRASSGSWGTLEPGNDDRNRSARSFYVSSQFAKVRIDRLVSPPWPRLALPNYAISLPREKHADGLGRIISLLAKVKRRSAPRASETKPRRSYLPSGVPRPQSLLLT